MMSKSSSFNPVIGCLKEDLSRRLWSIALSILTFFFALPVSLCVMISNQRGSIVDNPYAVLAREILEIYAKRSIFRHYQNMVGPGSAGLTLLLSLLAVVLAISGFAWLFSSKQTDFYHAMPIRREKLFGVVLLNGILIAAVPYAVFGAAGGLIIMLATGRKLALVLALTGFLYHMTQFLFVYAVAVTAVMLTGTLIVSILASGVLLGYAPLLVFTLSGLFTQYFITYLPDESRLFRIMEHSSPLLYGMDLTGSCNSHGFLLKGIIAVCWFAVLTLLNLYLYQKRPSEAAGRAICFDSTRAPIRIAVSVLAGLSVSALIRELLDGASRIDAWTVFTAVCGVVVTGCVMEIIYHADFKKLFAGPLRLVLSLALTLLVLAVFRFDLAGYNLYLPAADKLESAGVFTDRMESNLWELQQRVSLEENLSDGQYYVSYQNDRDQQLSLIDRMQYENPDTVLAIAQEGIRSLRLYPDIRSAQRQQGMRSFGFVSISYHLRNGRTVRRRYPVQNLERIRAQLDAVHDSSAFKQACYPVLSQDPDTLFGANYQIPGGTYHVPLLSSDEAEQAKLKELLTTYQEELLSLTAATRRKECPIACLQFKDYAFQNMVDIIRNQENGYVDVFNDMMYYPVYPGFTRTIALLNECGVDLSDPLHEEAAEYIRVYDCRSFFDGEEDYTGTKHLPTLIVDDPDEIRQILAGCWSSDLRYSNSMYPRYTGLDLYAAYDPAFFAGDRPSADSKTVYPVAAARPAVTREVLSEEVRECGLLLSADAIPAFLKEHYGLTDEDILLETGTDY